MEQLAGTVYTETVVHSAPEAFVNEAPYQLAIITLNSGGRVTGRMTGERVKIGDSVIQVDTINGIPCFRKAG